MQILLKVNQQAALQRGINANYSTIKLDVDPSTLTQVERDVLAAVLIGGHDATKRGIQCEPDEIVGQKYWNGSAYSKGDPTQPLELSRPDMEGLREAIGEILAERDQRHAKYVVQRDKNRAAAKASLDTLMATPAKERTVSLTVDGVETFGCDRVLTITYPEIDTYLSNAHHLAPEDKARYDEFCVVATSQNDIEKRNAIATAQPELCRIRKEQNDKRAAADKARADAEAKAKAEREAMIKRLPEVLQARIMAGYADEKEVSAALRQMALADAGLTHDEYAESRELRVLTDDEFVALENARELVAKGMPEASVMPVEVADKFGAWRKAAEDDDPDDIDDDGDVFEEGVNVRRRIEVTWDVAGITVKAAMPFEAFAKGEPQTQSQTPEDDSGIVG